MPPSVIALLLANAVPLLGVAWLDWDVLDVFALYWSENVVIGGFMLLRLLSSPALPIPVALGLTVFFAAHYGLFCFVHSVFVVGLLGDASAPHDFFGAPGYLLGIAAAGGGGLGLGLIALTASHGVSFVVNYLRHERRLGQPNPFAPYGRVVVMHVVLLLGVFLSFAVETGSAFLTLLVAAKIGVDVMAHRAEHRAAQRKDEPRGGQPPEGQPPEGQPPEGQPPDGGDYIAIE